MKLSKQQKFVISEMRNSNELGCTGFDNKRVPSNTIESLKKLKLIKHKPATIFNYELTELGKTIAI